MSRSNPLSSPQVKGNRETAQNRQFPAADGLGWNAAGGRSAWASTLFREDRLVEQIGTPPFLFINDNNQSLYFPFMPVCVFRGSCLSLHMSSWTDDYMSQLLNTKKNTLPETAR